MKTTRILPDDGAPDRDTKPFLAHLEDLRRTILWCVGALAGGMVVAAPLAPWILRALTRPLRAAGLEPSERLSVLSVAGGFAIATRIIFWAGLLLGLPVIVCAVARFVFPGLTTRERRAVVRASGLAGALFGVGVAMCYFWTLPVALNMMLRINDWLGTPSRFWQTSDYVGFALKLLIAFGLAFELPVIVVALGAMGFVTSDQLRSKRRHVIVGLLAAAMLLTPPDPYTMILMAVPLVALYELCIWLIRIREGPAGA